MCLPFPWLSLQPKRGKALTIHPDAYKEENKKETDHSKASGKKKDPCHLDKPGQ